jgi:hypothetical protein
MSEEQIFYDARKHSPKPNQVMAKYQAIAVLADGTDKEILVDFLLSNPLGAEMAVKTLRNRCGAIERDAIRVAINMAEDLKNGMSREDVVKKEYPMHIEWFFYCDKEDVPDDPHWSTIKLLRAEKALFENVKIDDLSS